jgi:hypothetical protein
MKSNIKKSLVSAIASYGNLYHKMYISNYNPRSLLSNWWAALDFFVSRACFQGRLNVVSERVYQAVREVLTPEFAKRERTANYRELSQQNWKPIKKELSKRIGKGKVGKARDVDMVLSALRFIEQIPNLNIVGYSVEQIRLGKIEKHYEELQPSRSDKGITQVGPKIAALYLRDLISLYHLEDNVPLTFAFCLQPIDVWVEKLAHKLKIVGPNANHLGIQRAIVKLCQEQGVSPLLFNQGAWYVGYHSFDILTEMLGKQG